MIKTSHTYVIAVIALLNNNHAFQIMQDEQPLSLQDELNLSEQQSDQQPETSNHFRQIFTKIFTLLKTTNNSADNNNVT